LNKILLLGGAGFIGTRLSQTLIERGYEVTVLDCFSEQVHGKDYKTSFLYNQINANVNLVYGDIHNAELLLSLLNKNEVVIHLASETGTAQSMYRLQRYTEVNIGSVAVLMDTLVNNKTNIKKVFLGSSRAVYGEGKYKDETGNYIYPNLRSKANLANGQFDILSELTGEPLQLVATDEDSLINPVSIYGFSKYAQEQLVKITCQTYGIDYCILRYQNVYGPGQSLLNSYTGVLNVFASRAILNKPLEIFEDGKGIRDFIYVDDAVEATILALENEEANNRTFNVGTGVGTSIWDAAINISKSLEKEVVCNVSGNYRYGDIRHSLADIHKIQHILDFKPKYTFKVGLREFEKWVMTQDIQAEFSDAIFNESVQKGVLRIKN
jgi:dTDP-L-rhamnose 4-epimerase